MVSTEKRVNVYRKASKTDGSPQNVISTNAICGLHPWLLPYSIHGSIFLQIHPVVKAVLGDLHSICLVSLDLADRTASALLDEQRLPVHGNARWPP